MTKVEIITLIKQIGGTDAGGNYIVDVDAIEVYYNDTMEELCKLPHCPLTDIVIVPVVSGTATYAYPQYAISIIAAFINDTQLSRTSVQQLEAYLSTWRSSSGTPFSFTRDRETARLIRLFPNPNTTGDAYIPPVAQPMGDDFPANNLTLMYTTDRDYDIYDWIAFYLVFTVLALEFAKPSNHQDDKFADACSQLADLIAQLVRIT